MRREVADKVFYNVFSYRFRIAQVHVLQLLRAILYHSLLDFSHVFEFPGELDQTVSWGTGLEGDGFPAWFVGPHYSLPRFAY